MSTRGQPGHESLRAKWRFAHYPHQPSCAVSLLMRSMRARIRLPASGKKGSRDAPLRMTSHWGARKSKEAAASTTGISTEPSHFAKSPLFGGWLSLEGQVPSSRFIKVRCSTGSGRAILSGRAYFQWLTNKFLHVVALARHEIADPCLRRAGLAVMRFGMTAFP